MWMWMNVREMPDASGAERAWVAVSYRQMETSASEKKKQAADAFDFLGQFGGPVPDKKGARLRAATFADLAALFDVPVLAGGGVSSAVTSMPRATKPSGGSGRHTTSAALNSSTLASSQALKRAARLATAKWVALLSRGWAQARAAGSAVATSGHGSATAAGHSR